MRNTLDEINFMLNTTEWIISEPKNIAIEPFQIEADEEEMNRG